MQQVSYLEGDPLMWMLHIIQKSVYDIYDDMLTWDASDITILKDRFFEKPFQKNDNTVNVLKNLTK